MGPFSTWEPRMLAIQGGKFTVPVYDLVPEKLLSPIPIAICPGWVEVPASWEHHIRLLVESGNRVIIYDAPHGLPLPIPADAQGARIELEKMATLIAVLNALFIRRADLICRSEGAIWAVLAAKHHSSNVRNLILENPAGLLRRNWPLPFIVRWLRDFKQTVTREVDKTPPFAPVPAWSVWARSWKDTAREIWALMFANSLPALTEVRATGHGVAIVTTEFDLLFPCEKIRENVKGLIDWHCVLRGGHTSFFCRPEDFVGALVEARNFLERKYR